MIKKIFRDITYLAKMMIMAFTFLPVFVFMYIVTNNPFQEAK